jgi:hypothetical protein
MRIIATIVVFIISITLCYSQRLKHIDICGTVVDSTKNVKIEYATIQFKSAINDSLIYGTITDSLGKFCINNALCQEYKLIFSCLGYKTKKISLDLTDIKSDYYFKIGLIKDEYMLDQVEIVGKQEGVTVKVDKTVFIPDSLSLANSATGLDLLDKAPGVTVKKTDQSIKLLGSSNVLVLVDGINNNRDLNTIDPEDIERIELIDNPSSKYDSDVANVINIILKEERKGGLKISTNLTYFTENKYNFSKVQIDYEINKLRLFAGYKIKYHNIFSNDSIYRTSTEEDIIKEYEGYSQQSNYSTSFGNIIQYGAEYRFLKKNLINITGNFEIHDYQSDFNHLTTYKTDKNTDYQTDAFSDRNGRNILQNYTLYYIREFNNDKRKLTFNTNYYLMKKDFSLNQNTKFLFFPDSSEIETFSDISTAYEINAINSNINFENPVKENISSEFGCQLYYRDIDNHYYYTDLSSYFRYKDFRTAYYGVLTFFKNKYSLQVGIRAENYLINIYDSIRFDQWNYLPSVSCMYEINNKNRVKLVLNSKLNYPRYQMLAPFTFYSNDSLTVSSGNPYLKPEKYLNTEVNYSYRKNRLTFLSSSLYFRNYNNLIGLETNITNNNILTERYNNITYSQQLGGYIFFQTSFFKLITTSMYIDVFYNIFEQKQYNGLSYKFWTTNEILLPFEFFVNVDLSVNGKEFLYNGYFYQSPLIDEVSLGKSIFKGHGELSISMLNYFIQDHSKDVRRGSNYYEESILYPDNKCILIRFNYFFKKGKKLKGIERELNMERDEK